MAIWYWDPVGGNNSNDGTTFANRKLTLQSLTTVAAGDTVRCIASPAPVDTGQTATWTDGSNTVTLTSAVTQVVASCDTNWTASTNVTCATSTIRKEGTNSVIVTIAAGFTTGKAAYFATGTLNCSTYQQLTFWMMQTAGTLMTATNYVLSLCSDTAGATQVNNFTIPITIGALNTWFPVTIDLGTALGSSIQSIALYRGTNTGAQTFQFDQISVAGASASAGSITLTSLISKNNSQNEWLGIRSINGTSITLDSSPNYTLNLTGTEPTWSGTTETVELWRRETLKTLQVTTLSTVVNNYAGATGSLGNIVTISGGWDTTNMSTQTGQTYLDGQNGFGYGLQIGANTSLAYMNVSNINCYRYYYGAYIQSSNANPNINFTSDNFNNNGQIGLFIAGNTRFCSYTINNLNKNGYNTTSYGVQMAASSAANRATYTFININSNWQYGAYFISTGTLTTFYNTINITNCNRNSYDGIILQGCVANTINITNLLYNSSINGANSNYGQIQFLPNNPAFSITSNNSSFVSCHDNIVNIGNITNTTNTSYGIMFGVGAENNKIIMTGAFSGFGNSSYAATISVGGANYITSSGAIFPVAQYWGVSAGCAKIYFSTNDLLTAQFLTQTGGSAAAINKNNYGIPNNTLISGQVWGLA